MKIFYPIFLLGLLVTQVGLAEKTPTSKTTKKPMMEWTKEQRENMAKMHEGMATCLRSDKSMMDCRAEMKTQCDGMGKDGCPMMGKGMRGMMMTE